MLLVTDMEYFVLDSASSAVVIIRYHGKVRQGSWMSCSHIHLGYKEEEGSISLKYRVRKFLFPEE